MVPVLSCKNNVEMEERVKQHESLAWMEMLWGGGGEGEMGQRAVLFSSTASDLNL